MLVRNRFALKEWAIVEKALAEGRQTLLLRKGGLIEKKQGFSIEHTEFFIYPTYLHQHREGIIPAMESELREFLKSPPPEDRVVISHYAVVNEAYPINRLEQLKRLEGHHAFNFQEVSKRFNYRNRPGLHLILLRVYRLPDSIELPVLPHYAGCRSWVDLGRELSTEGCRPVLDDEAYHQEVKSVQSLLT